MSMKDKRKEIYIIYNEKKKARCGSHIAARPRSIETLIRVIIKVAEVIIIGIE